MTGLSGRFLRTAAAASLVAAALVAAPARADVTVSPKQQAWVLRDAQGREVTLRGFNVSGSTKLYENSLLPFRSTADAVKSAQAMRDLTGANVVRFLISWEGVQPAPDRIDYAYLDKAIAQIKVFTDRGINVLLDYHQDLYSAHLFNKGSWYTGDGAPKWVIQAGGYPKESCGICILWGQNMQTNGAVRQAMYDFWRDRVLTTSAGPVGVQSAYLQQAEAMMTYVKQKLPPESFNAVIGMDPLNEPFDGGLDGKKGVDWEKTHLMPFYQRFRSAMDRAGWTSKPAYVEPLVFWNTAFFEEGGMTTVGPLGSRMVFNTHYYDGARITLDPSPATDGTYAESMNEIRQRAASLRTAPFVSEFGHKLSGGGSDRTPWMIRSMYQSMDAGVAGKNWWSTPASSGDVLSSTQWHWDIYSGRHHELMNGNPDKVQTEGDAWNDEDHSVVATDDAGAVKLRLDQRVLDRLYPAAVSGDSMAFAYEDLARSGYGGTGREQPWLIAPSSMPDLSALVQNRQYGVLVWRSGSSGAPTELHLPQSFTPAATTVVSDLATVTGLPGSGPVTAAPEPGSTTAKRLRLTAPPSSGVHVALIVNTGTGTPPTSAQLTAARAQLSAWLTQKFPAS
ncbi:cellulase family glycosylhydrolase [Actinomadura rudentiformis]|uniref:Cellulase family glycosylhydrolase n=1 Tax=Actinomadura rudentiformis TaxID=359158 RepID=A0A6H9Y7R7_9ACTN|nr:cellulase family glycosylhydrolase [Actinomadura rudentiformis]KAB2339964.1 cellulase family glycosylhydrolase [Actinomadura rudentiformis]